MTIEEAIEVIEYARAFNEENTPLMKAWDLIIDYVRAQQDAEKGCKYCRNGEVIAWDMCNDAITIETDGKIHILEAGDWECQINYCPMCGRQLRRPPVKEI